ncbi:hypothetical protein EUX98_g713 [Antrodiella citrinella]|uniref:FAD-binding domain-containing protein n=1 Tax=Antrodiella citrinella TaxID=2447956 RepID=A0A4S4N350_9APHY|nr:hypothetical protein EUX98_g713 [Antrodiella citrinella]
MLKEAGGDYAMIQVRTLPNRTLSARAQTDPLSQYGDLWQILYESALESGAEVLSGLDVTDIDPNNSSVTVSNGDVLTADLIIGADGPRGRGRRILLDQDQTEERMPKSFMTYQATIPTERMTRYPELDELTKGQISRTIRLIFAEGKVLHFFPINHGSAYCIQYCPNDDSFEGHWGDKQITRLSDVAGICEPKILRIAEIADPAIAVRMPDNIKLEHWVHDSQQFIVVGEAAHPFPPASQQGIAMAFEDAAVLGKLFGHLSSKDQIGNFLYAFEDIRQTRCYSSFQDDVALYRFLAMPPGPNQRERDARLKESTREEGKEEGLDAVEDTSMARKQWEEVKKVYAYDCEDEADEWWIQWGVLRQRAAERNEFYDKSSFGSREA